MIKKLLLALVAAGTLTGCSAYESSYGLADETNIAQGQPIAQPRLYHALVDPFVEMLRKAQANPVGGGVYVAQNLPSIMAEVKLPRPGVFQYATIWSHQEDTRCLELATTVVNAHNGYWGAVLFHRTDNSSFLSACQAKITQAIQDAEQA